MKTLFEVKLKNIEEIGRKVNAKKGDSMKVELSKAEFSILNKLVNFAFAERNDRTCNDVEESDLGLTDEEKTIALSIINQGKEDDPDEELTEYIDSDYKLETIVTDLLGRIEVSETS